MLHNCCPESVPPAPLNVVLTTLPVIFAKNSKFLSSKSGNVLKKNIRDRKILNKFFLCTLSLWFCHPWLTFLSEQNNTRSPKQATKSKVYFHHHFLKVLRWIREMRLWQPWENIFTGNPMIPFIEGKLTKKLLLPVKLLKMFICKRRLRFWELWLNVFLKFQVFSAQIPIKNFQKNIFFKVNFPIFLSPHLNRCLDIPD